jgi:hypothetical protein
MPDQPALVDYVDAMEVTGLMRIGDREFLTRNHRFVLAGRTTAAARIEVVAESSGSLARSSADADGTFRVRLSINGNQETYRLLVTAPSGYVTEDRFSVTRDDQPPQLTLAPEPPPMTRNTRLRLHGQVSGGETVVHDTLAIEVREGVFDLQVDLQPGPNMVAVVARDRIGNETRWQRTVFLDRDPPELLDHTIAARPGSGGRTLDLSVRAVDASGLKRVAHYSLRVASATVTGTLLLDPLTQTYRGVTTLDRPPQGPVTLDSLVLEDYSGNRQVFRF